MTSFKKHFNRRLTVRETALIVVCLLALIGIGYMAFNFINVKILEARVNAATPKVCAEIRAQRKMLEDAIEAYKAYFGVYPPDHVVSKQPMAVDAVNNPLLYELAGVTYDPTNKVFMLPHLEAADEKFVKEFFQCDGFKNAGPSAEQVKHFLTTEPLPAHQLHDDPDVFAAGFSLSYEEFPPEVSSEFEIGSWCYVSSSPTNNPGKYDLWIELKNKRWSAIIGNWKGVE